MHSVSRLLTVAPQGVPIAVPQRSTDPLPSVSTQWLGLANMLKPLVIGPLPPLMAPCVPRKASRTAVSLYNSTPADLP